MTVQTAQGYQSIEVERDEPLAIVTFNRPKQLNAFSRDLQREVIQALDELAHDDRIRVVILTGAGRAFSAGYDIATEEDTSQLTVAEWKQRLHEGSWRYSLAIWNFPKPIIAATHGYCLAGACEIAMLCDMTISSDDCKFGEPEIRFATGSPALIMPWVVPMKIAKELLYSGKMISAQRAYEIGMVNEVVPADQVMKRARYHGLVISKVAPLAVRLTKEAINRSYEMAGLVNAMEYNANLVSVLDGSETEEFRQFEDIRMQHGLRAALDWRDQQFKEVEDVG